MESNSTKESTLKTRKYFNGWERVRWVTTATYRDTETDEVFAAIIRYTSEQYGLHTPSEIRLHVSTDGQCWYTERETIAG